VWGDLGVKMILTRWFSKVPTRDQSQALKKYKIDLLRRYIIDYIKNCRGAGHFVPVLYYELGGGWHREWSTYDDINEIPGTQLPIDIELNYSGPKNSQVARQTDKLVKQLKALGYVYTVEEKDADFKMGGRAVRQLLLKS
jgi:hypothetical protein